MGSMAEQNWCDLEHAMLHLPDGTIVPARPIRPTDKEALKRFHLRLSQQSIYMRFFGLMPELSDERAHYFTHLDGHERFAFVALDPGAPGEIIGVVRWDAEPGTDAGEYAIIIEDRWQGRGLGYALTRALIAAAQRRGYRTMYAMVLPENTRMLNLLRELDYPVRRRWVDGMDRVELDISAPKQAART